MERILAEQLEIMFDSEVTPEHAEGVIRKLDRENSSSAKVLLRFLGYPYMNPGTGWRIGNALRRYSGELLEVAVPPFGGEWFRTFTRSGLGLAIATHAGKIVCDGEDVTNKVREYYLETAVRRDQNAIFYGDLHRGLSINPEREDQFRDAFLGSLRNVNVRPTHFDREQLRDVVKVAFEAIQNVYDHAGRKPLSDGTRIVSYFLLAYYKTVAGHPDPSGHLNGYIKRLASSTNRKRTDFMQVCVNDDGIGIAARQTLDPSIYWGPKEDEEKAVRSALTARSSVKLRAHDSRVRGVPGQGYTYIDSCLRALRAFAILRTGRLLAVFDGTDEHDDAFALVSGNLGYMPGTTLDILIPILKEGDGQPSLFPDD